MKAKAKIISNHVPIWIGEKKKKGVEKMPYKMFFGFETEKEREEFIGDILELKEARIQRIKDTLKIEEEKMKKTKEETELLIKAERRYLKEIKR